MERKHTARALNFLWLGVLALGLAGLFALVLVIGRTPQLQALSVVQQFFSVALVVHVDLSVLIWFLCVGGMGWSLLEKQFALAPPYWAQTGFVLMAMATGLIALSPINPHWEVLKSNYIPVLNNLNFLGGLGFLAAGLLVILLPLLGLAAPKRFRQLRNAQLCFASAGVTTLLALAAFAISAWRLPEMLDTEERFNTLFWAGGHGLQFTYILLMMAGWVVLAEQILPRPLPRRVVLAACAVAVLAALAGLAGFAGEPVTSAAFGDRHTRLMIELGGVAPAILAGGMLVSWLFPKHAIESPAPRRALRAYRSSLLSSLLLFAAGGGLGLMIAGQNVIIPAHYHGEIVAVTLALMGLAYAMLPQFGYQSVAATRLAFWQPILYGAGQLMHVGGLAYSGGYGVLRKTAGGFAQMAPEVKIALGIMGLGGTLAILGGLLFVVVMLRARRDRATGVL